MTRAMTMLLSALILGLGSVGALHGQGETRSTAAADESAWRLVWADEFDGEGLPDPAKWSYDVGGHGWGNEELQFYTERRPENARVEDGHLVIEARRDHWEGHEYTSARLVTRGRASWQYGRIEVRARLPRGLGTWPAIWMLPKGFGPGSGVWPDDGEIDIMEHVGYNEGVVYGTVHTKSYNHKIGTQRGGTIEVPDATDAFHDYAIQWHPDRIEFLVDDALYFTFPNEGTGVGVWPFDKPFYLILNIAVGGAWGGAQGVDPEVFPQRLVVDHVRVYESTSVDE